jgi:hypothetical protein
MRRALLVERLHLSARSGDGGRKLVHLRRHLRQQLHDRARSLRAGQCTGVALIGGEAREALGGALHVGQQRLAGQRIGMGFVEILHIALQRHRQMLLERRRPRQSGGIEPARHGDDHEAANAHGEEQRGALRHRGDDGHEAHHEGPERVDRDGDGGGVDDGGKEDEGRCAIEQAAHAQIGVDARRQRQDGEGKPRHRLDAGKRLLDPRDIVLTQHEGRSRFAGTLMEQSRRENGGYITVPSDLPTEPEVEAAAGGYSTATSRASATMSLSEVCRASASISAPVTMQSVMVQMVSALTPKRAARV